MEMKRGDVVICAAPAEYGKPRPAVVVQSGLFNGTHSSVVVCLITSHLEDAPLFRIPVPAGKATGLKTQLTRSSQSPGIGLPGSSGALAAGHLKEVDNALRLWLEPA